MTIAISALFLLAGIVLLTAWHAGRSTKNPWRKM